eukprot:9099619-Alexandrium_andersonii.AAC.1
MCNAWPGYGVLKVTHLVEFGSPTRFWRLRVQSPISQVAPNGVGPTASCSLKLQKAAECSFLQLET